MRRSSPVMVNKVPLVLWCFNAAGDAGTAATCRSRMGCRKLQGTEQV